MFYIRNQNEYWTGSSWTIRIDTAREYDLEEGKDVIDKRFHKGIRRMKRNGEFYWKDRPLLVIHQTEQKS